MLPGILKKGGPNREKLLKDRLRY